MPLKIGYLDKNGHPNVKIRVWGIDSRFKQEFEAMIDTGFTGFLKLPITMALPLGLTLMGTGDSTLADGSKSPMLLTLGTVELDGQETNGVVALDSGGTPLLGMAFLRQCQHTLMAVILVARIILLTRAEWSPLGSLKRLESTACPASPRLLGVSPRMLQRTCSLRHAQSRESA